MATSTPASTVGNVFTATSTASVLVQPLASVIVTVLKLVIPNKNPMQSGLAKSNKWILEYKTEDPTKNPLMGWESSSDTYTELKLEFSSKELAINYAKKKKIDFELIEPRKRKTVKKSYADNFHK